MIFNSEFELQVLHNRVLLRTASRSEAVDRKAVYKFSNEKLLIADQVHFEEELKRAFREAAPAWKFFSRPTVIITRVSQPLAPIERVALHAAIREAGARKIIDKATPEPVYRKLDRRMTVTPM